jgi:transcriptional regulator with XRE-family HTH domain
MTGMISSQRDELSRLVRDRRAELGRSLAQVAAAADEAAVSAQWVNKLELGQLAKAPTREHLAALARGLQVPFALVARAAAAQYFGFEETHSVSGEVRAVMAHMGDLDEDEQRQVRAIVEAFARSRRPRSGDPSE